MMLKLAVVLKGLVLVSSLAQFGSWLDVLISLFIQEVMIISSLDQGPSENYERSFTYPFVLAADFSFL